MLADRPHGRRLSPSEQRRLNDLERLLDGDPALSTALTGRVAETAPPMRLGGRVVIVAAVAVAAVLVVLAGVVGGPGGAAATAVALAVTVAACFGGRIAARRRLRQKATFPV